MARITLLILLVLSFLPLTFAQSGGYSVSCSGITGASGCVQCYRYNLSSINYPQDSVIPRSGLQNGQYEFVYLDQSTITAQTLQGATVTPTGNVTSRFNLAERGVGSDPWAWATIKTGEAVTRGNIPDTIDYSQPVYVMRFSPRLGVKDNTNTIVPDTDVSRQSCALFYVSELAGCGARNNSSLYDTSSTGTGLTASSSGLCASGSSINFTYNASLKKWTWNCTASGGQTSCQATRAYCGNSTVESDEQCDDGNTSNTDSCNNSCQRVAATNPSINIVVDDDDNHDDRQTVTSGTRPRFSITVSNTGNTALRDVEVTDSRAPLCDRTIGNLAIGESKTHKCDGPVTSNAFTNTVRVTARSSTNTSTTLTDEDDTQVTVQNAAVPAINVILDDADNHDDRQTVAPGARPRFSITVTNTGNADLRDVVVADQRAPLCDRTIGSLAVGESKTHLCDGPVTYNAFTNTVRIAARSSTNSTVVSDEDDTDVRVTDTEEAECGNGVTEEDEECDDGNRNNNDSCDNSCEASENDPRCRVRTLDSYGSAPFRTTIMCTGEPLDNTFIVISRNGRNVGTYKTDEKTYTFNQAGDYTITCYPDDSRENRYNSCETIVEIGAECGNGVVEQDEQCDDGNTVSGDSCSRYCRDSGSMCGNGMVDSGEDCDDGNNYNGDYCSNICQSSTPTSGPASSLAIMMLLSLLGVGSYFGYRKYRA